MEKEPLTLKLFGRTISFHHMDENHGSGDDAEKPRGDHEAGDEDEEEERRKKREEKAECPRCKSMDTKFCYYNNYNVNQPRHYCRKCQRYWTSGGALRNVPIGAGRRKHKAPQHPNYSISPCVISASNPSVFSQPMSVYTSSSQVYVPNLGSEGFPINVHNMSRKRREACPPQSEPVEGVICDASSSNSSSFVLSFSNSGNSDGSILSVENDKVGVQMMKRPKDEPDIHCNDVMKNQLTLNCGRVSNDDDPTCSKVLSFSLSSENSRSSPSLSTSCSRVFSS